MAQRATASCDRKRCWVVVTSEWSKSEELLRILEGVLTETMHFVHNIRTGRTVPIDGHRGDEAREVDVFATEVMRALVAERLPAAFFLAEDAQAIPTDEVDVVWLADAVDGTRQHMDLGFGFACSASIHVRTDRWAMVAAGIVNSSLRFAGMAPGITTDLFDVEIHNEFPAILIGASRPTRVSHLLRLADLLDPKIGRIWNTGGNPVLPNFIHTHMSVLAQVSPSAPWDCVFAPIAHAAGFQILRLDRTAHKDAVVQAEQLLSWFAIPFYGEDRVVPPIAIGRPDNRLLFEVWRTLSSDLGGTYE